jgi:hypothetical protein
MPKGIGYGKNRYKSAAKKKPAKKKPSKKGSKKGK